MAQELLLCQPRPGRPSLKQQLLAHLVSKAHAPDAGVRALPTAGCPGAGAAPASSLASILLPLGVDMQDISSSHGIPCDLPSGPLLGSSGAPSAPPIDLGCGRAGCFCMLTGMPCGASPAVPSPHPLAGGGGHAVALGLSASAVASGPAAGHAPHDASIALPSAPAGATLRSVLPHALQLADALMLECGDLEEAAEYAAWLALMLE